jgi:hypothetical protein
VWSASDHKAQTLYSTVQPATAAAASQQAVASLLRYLDWCRQLDQVLACGSGERKAVQTGLLWGSGGDGRGLELGLEDCSGISAST